MVAEIEGAAGGTSVSRVPIRDQYIASPAFDWVFFIGVPLVAVAIVMAAAYFLPAARIEYYVIGYMAVGHHIPTMIRAYGDPGELSRNRVQLFAIPLCVAPLVIALTLFDARLLTLIFVWDQYHFIRQHYGFMRIYNAKAGLGGDVDSSLDHWLCFSFFICILAHSGFYGYMFADSFYDVGIAVPNWLVNTFRTGSLVVAIGVGVVYLARLQSRIARGLPVAWLKLAVFATSLGVWYYAYVVITDGFLNYAISSLFHCIQYDAFAWHYNRKKARAMTPTRGNAFFRMINKTSNLWMYIAAIWSYGLLSAFGKDVSLAAFLALNTTTGVLHYYFDAFIWRVQRVDFREHL